MSFYLNEKIDFEKHNAEVKKLWEDFSKNKHERIPVSIGGSIRNLLSNPELNQTGFSFEDFFAKAEAQLKCQLDYQHYQRHNFLCDREMGLPETSWNLSLDFQNSYDQAWFGCPLMFFGNEDVPDTEEILKENPEAFYDWGDPDPFWGRGDFMKKAVDIRGELAKICKSGYEFHGLPVEPPRSFQPIGTDGLFSVALKLRGTVELMCDMYENPKYYHDLMDYITRNLIARRKAHREWAWDNDPNYEGERKHKGSFGYVDDSIAMISTEQFKEFVAPYQRRLYDEFHDGYSPNSIHLCGDATHHFKYLMDEFNVQSFDTGFPVDHGAIRKQLGPNVNINGGPTIMTVKEGPVEKIDKETKDICESGVLDGGRFVLIAANNLAPCTPVENIKALYEAGKKYGKIEK